MNCGFVRVKFKFSIKGCGWHTQAVTHFALLTPKIKEQLLFINSFKFKISYHFLERLWHNKCEFSVLLLLFQDRQDGAFNVCISEKMESLPCFGSSKKKISKYVIIEPWFCVNKGYICWEFLSRLLSIHQQEHLSFAHLTNLDSKLRHCKRLTCFCQLEISWPYFSAII